jgi:hypothetical protein
VAIASNAGPSRAGRLKPALHIGDFGGWRRRTARACGGHVGRHGRLTYLATVSVIISADPRDFPDGPVPAGPPHWADDGSAANDDMTWRERLSDPWYVLPISVLAGAVLALSLAIALEPDDNLPAQLAAAFEPTAEPTVTPTPTPDPGALIRDERRRLDLFAVKLALEAYYRDHGAFPYSSPGVQTLCVYEDADAGCKLRPYLDPIPVDVLGDPVNNGYWYESDGLTYTLYAAMETNVGIDESSCPSPRPERLAKAFALLCIPGGPPGPP